MKTLDLTMSAATSMPNLSLRIGRSNSRWAVYPNITKGPNVQKRQKLECLAQKAKLKAQFCMTQDCNSASFSFLVEHFGKGLPLSHRCLPWKFMKIPHARPAGGQIANVRCISRPTKCWSIAQELSKTKGPKEEQTLAPFPPKSFNSHEEQELILLFCKPVYTYT